MSAFSVLERHSLDAAAVTDVSVVIVVWLAVLRPCSGDVAVLCPRTLLLSR